MVKHCFRAGFCKCTHANDHRWLNDIEQIRQRITTRDVVLEIADKYALFPELYVSDPTAVAQQIRENIEVEMLDGAWKMLSEQKVGYIFISTHSNQIHYQCKKVLENLSYHIIASIDLDASYSWDGILVAKLPG